MTLFTDIQPGDLCVVGTSGHIPAGIRLAERIADHGRKSRWNHVVVATRWTGPGKRTLMIAEAEPGGAKEVPWHYAGNPHCWSTGVLPVCVAAGEAARRYTQAGPWGKEGVPYSELDYVAIAAHTYHVPAPGLQEFIATEMHMICSQFGDQSRLDGGSHLFTDDRWPGFVKPSDIGFLLADHRRPPEQVYP